jgi:predicted metal-dependent hydrolase
MIVVYRDLNPFVALDPKRIILTVRPGSAAAKRAEVVHDWHKALLHQLVPLLIHDWKQKLKVEVRAYFLQRMKTKSGSLGFFTSSVYANASPHTANASSLS